MRYAKTKPGEWIQPIRWGYKMICCDCRLVHALDFRLVAHASGKKIQFRARRDNRATGQIRRRMRKRAGLCRTKKNGPGGVKTGLP
ncbi:MAG: hypothetical protein A2Y86_05270 [Candidatus Aminicenantes bacterium RBG_13_62_12]|nr:MAG: hypothetical protein A2Y86_05270 [Candidatus Aminicenantes bacterium RBG_13_62_12]